MTIQELFNDPVFQNGLVLGAFCVIPGLVILAAMWSNEARQKRLAKHPRRN